MQIRTISYLGLLMLLICEAALAAPSIGSLTDNASSYPNGAVPKYEKYQATFAIGNVGTAFVDYNPFNPNVTALGSQYYNLKGIKVDATFTSPTNRTITWPAFWYKSSSGSTSWMLRFAPTETGVWKYRITVRYGADTVTSQEYSFTCVASTSHGFLGIDQSDTRFFRFADGAPFFPVGANMTGCDDAPPGSTAWGTAFPKMKAVGANYSRLFMTSLNIEPYNVGSDRAALKALNNYDMTRALTIDSVLDLAHTNGIYMEWVIDDATYLVNTSNQYIAVSGREAPCVDVAEFFSLSTAREIYKRKLRYWMARWGYSVNLVNIELINEIGEHGTTAAWHIDMGNYLHAYTDQPHLVSSSNGSGELKVNGVPWTDASMDYVNYHDYAKYTQGWNIKSDQALEPLGCTLQYPWVDFAVYADRLARLQFKRLKWNKPLCWTEFGLIFRRPGDSDFPDWDLAYQLDTSAHHVKDCMWAGALNGMAVTHWKLDYMFGNYGGGDKFWIFAPLVNYLKGEDFVGLVQETTYPVADPLNPSPKVTCTNSNLMVVTMHGPGKAFFYVKNLTDTWFREYYYGQTTDRYADSSKIPNPAAGSATVKVFGMTPGTYTVEKWSTTDGSAAPTNNTITVGSDGIATVSVSSVTCDAAYKIKPATQPTQPPSLSLTLTADMRYVRRGDTITYTVTYSNAGTGSAQNATVSGSVPSYTTFVSASSGGSYNGTTRKVSWIIPSVSAGASGAVTFQARVN